MIGPCTLRHGLIFGLLAPSLPLPPLKQGLKKEARGSWPCFTRRKKGNTVSYTHFLDKTVALVVLSRQGGLF